MNFLGVCFYFSVSVCYGTVYFIRLKTVVRAMQIQLRHVKCDLKIIDNRNKSKKQIKCSDINMVLSKYIR
jgi:hypothetical protein